MYGIAPTAEKSASHIAAINIEKRKYQKNYMDYWNSTTELTATGRPLDAFIMPVAAIAAARPNMYNYFGRCCFCCRPNN